MVTIGDLALWTSARRQEIILDQHSPGTFAKVTLESTCDSAQISITLVFEHPLTWT